MAGEFTRIVPTGAGTRKQMDGTVRVYGDVIVLYIDRDFAGRRATFESDGNGTMRIVFAQDGDYKVSEPISKHGPLRMTARQRADGGRCALPEPGRNGGVMSEQHTPQEPWHDLVEMKNTLLGVKALESLDAVTNDRLAWAIGMLNVRIEREKSAHETRKYESELSSNSVVLR